jgi:small multidrug resistance family-3 protein
MSRLTQILVMVVAAVCEVGGDALIRKGLRGKGAVLIVVGMLTLAVYGVVVNLIPMDFSRLLGAYVGVFALVSVGFGALMFGEVVSPLTWLGVAIVLCGSAVIQLASAN